jgi:uncharacterized OB-fold protein
MMSERLNPEFAGFFESARRGVLSFPRCGACARFHWYPMPLCPHCRSADVRWQAVSGRGELFSFTSVKHAFDPKRADSLPYTVGLVTFPDAPGVQFITNIIDAPAEALAIGMPVEAVFDRAGDGLVLFRPATPTSGRTV